MEKSPCSKTNAQPGIWSEAYNCQFVAPIDNVKCPVCHDVVKDAHVTSCCEGHFCGACIRRVLTGEGRCPLCREPSFKALASKKYNLKVQMLNVHCTLKNRGCTWIGQLQELDRHLDAKNGMCRFVDVECTNGCGQKVGRDSLHLHLQVSCPKVESSCPHCRATVTKGNMVTHWVTCPAYPLPCPNLCGTAKLPRSEMEPHLSVKCPLQPMACEFGYAGCEGKIARCDLARHMEESAQRHLSLVGSFLNGTLRDHEKKTSAKERELIGLREELRALRLSVNVPPVEFECDLYGREKWWSPDFRSHLGGYLLCLCVTGSRSRTTSRGPSSLVKGAHCSEGGSKDSKELSLFLEVKGSQLDSLLNWPQSISVTLEVPTPTGRIKKSVRVTLTPKSSLFLLTFPANSLPPATMTSQNTCDIRSTSSSCLKLGVLGVHIQ